MEPRQGTILPVQAETIKRDPVAAWARRNDVPLETRPRGLETDKETGKRLPLGERKQLLRDRYECCRTWLPRPACRKRCRR